MLSDRQIESLEKLLDKLNVEEAKLRGATARCENASFGFKYINAEDHEAFLLITERMRDGNHRLVREDKLGGGYILVGVDSEPKTLSDEKFKILFSAISELGIISKKSECLEEMVDGFSPRPPLHPTHTPTPGFTCIASPEKVRAVTARRLAKSEQNLESPKR